MYIVKSWYQRGHIGGDDTEKKSVFLFIFTRGIASKRFLLQQ